MTRTATRLLPVALAGALALAAGCTAEDRPGRAAAVSEWGFPTADDLAGRVQQRVADGGWSALMTSTTELDDAPAAEFSGRVNFGNSLTGRLRWTQHTEDGPLTADVVATADGLWSRVETESRWRREDGELLGDDPSTEDYSGFATALLRTGPDVVKDIEAVEPGLQAVRVSGRLTLDQIGVFSGWIRFRLSEIGVTSVDLDLWIDAEGRVRRSEQWMTAGSRRLHNVVTFTEPGPVFPVERPEDSVETT